MLIVMLKQAKDGRSCYLLLLHVVCRIYLQSHERVGVSEFTSQLLQIKPDRGKL